MLLDEERMSARRLRMRDSLAWDDEPFEVVAELWGEHVVRRRKHEVTVLVLHAIA